VGLITPTDYYTYTNTTSGPVTLNLSNLPVAGTYTAVVYTTYGLPATAQLTLAAGATSTLPTTGVSQSDAATVAGQNVYSSFTATQGQNLELTLNNVSLTGGTYFSVNVYNAVGTNVGSLYCYATNPGASCNLPLWNLAAGTYSVVATPSSSSEVLKFSALLQPDVVGPTLTAGTPANITLAAGQAERVTFAGTLGGTVALQLTGVTTVPTGQYVTVAVYRPDVGLITPTDYYTYTNTTSGPVTLNLSNLPVAGTYTAVVYTTYGLPATAQLTLATGATGTLPATGVSQSDGATVAGQNVYRSFTATQGENLELTLNHISVPGSTNGGGFTVNVYNAAGTGVASFWCYPTNPGASCTEPLWNLAAGTYTMVASPYYGGTLSFDAQLQPDVVGPTLTAGTPANITLAAGQAERVKFTGTVGGTVALQLTGVTTVPAGQNVYVTVYRPDVGLITPTDYYTYTNTTSGPVTLNLSNLPAAGTYTAVVYTSYGLPATAQLTLGPGAVPAAGSTENYASTTANANVYMTFVATTNQNLELTLSNVSAAGATTSGFEVNVYGPSGNGVAIFDCYAANPGASCTQSLWGLAAGTYSVVAVPLWGGMISFTAQLEPDVVKPALVANTAATVTLGAGQVERFTFAGTAGGATALQLSGVSTTPTGQSMSITVYQPGTTVTTTSYETQMSTTGSNTLNLPNLPASGTYTVVVNSSYGIPASAQLTLVPP